MESSKSSRGLWTLLAFSLLLNAVLLVFITRHFQISIYPKPLALSQTPTVVPLPTLPNPIPKAPVVQHEGEDRTTSPQREYSEAVRPVFPHEPVPVKVSHEFSDEFPSEDSLDHFVWTNENFGYSDAAAQQCTVSNSELLQTAPPGGRASVYAVVHSALFDWSLSDYIVEADFKLEHWSGKSGLFGLLFRSASNGNAYVFQLNSCNDRKIPQWQIEKRTGPNGGSYTFLPGSGFGMGANDPVYPLGSWVHLKVVALGNHCDCYVNLYDGKGDQKVFSLSDPGVPFSNGGVGIRTLWLVDPNQLHVRHFHVKAAGSPIAF